MEHVKQPVKQPTETSNEEEVQDDTHIHAHSELSAQQQTFHIPRRAYLVPR